MKGYKKIVPIALVICVALSFYMLVSTRTSTVDEYNSYLASARNYAKQGIAVDALENYAKALGIKNTVDINIEVGNFYVEMNDVIGAIGWGEKMTETFPTSPEAYEFLLTRYRENNDFNRCYALYDTIAKRKLTSDGITKIMNDIKYVYYYGEAFEEVGAFSQGYCSVRYEDQWGLVDETGRKTAPTVFKTVGPYMDGLAPVSTEDGEYYFIDNQGNKKMTLQIDGPVAGLTAIAGGVYAVSDGSIWTFYNKNYDKINGGYTDVSLLANSVVAVESDSQWMILNEKYENISDQKYVDIVQDDRGIISRNGVIFVNQGRGYSMIDTSGNPISNKVFADAKMFLDNTYAAVKTEQGWTFIDSAGEFVFKDTYFEDANSFLNGFAAVKKNGQWGYIDSSGHVVIEFQFKEAKNFNSRGCAFVKNEDVWQLLRLYSKNYEN